MTPLENRQDGRNVHVMIQVDTGKQYVVLDEYFVKNGVRCAHLKWFEKSPEAAASRAMNLLSPKISPSDYVIYNARALTPDPNYFAVWFATAEQFHSCVAQWSDCIMLVSDVANITPRKEKALARICSKAAEVQAKRFEEVA